MKKIQVTLFLLLAIVFSSCFSSKISYDHMERIHRGMFSEGVIAILGKPSYRSFDDNGEILEFRSTEYGTAKVIKIRFMDNKVVEMKSYLDKNEHNCRDEEKSTKDKKI